MIVNPLVWFMERELNFVPRHFIKCPTPITSDSKQWVQNKTTGRYCFAPLDQYERLVTSIYCVYFEDEKDAMMYELIWAGAPS